MHRAGLVHCDVKASNVMLEPQVGPVLMDFGAGVDVESQDRPLFGSPLSMAPEQFKGSAATPRSDQYSLGVLLYRPLAGDYPLRADSLAGLAERHRAGPRPSLPGTVPRALRRLVSTLLSPEPRGRPTADDTVKALDRIVKAPARRRRATALALVFTSLLAGTVLATLGYVRAQRSESRAIAAQSESEAINQFLTEMLMSPRGSEGGPEVKMVDVLEHAEDDLDRAFADQPLAQAQALYVLGRTWRFLRERERSVRLLRRASICGSRSETRLSPALPSISETVSDCMEALGPDHLVTLIASALEGAVIGALTEEPEEWSRAEELIRHAHDALRKNLGEDSVVTMEAGVFLAELLIRTGSCDRARPILLDFNERAERLLAAGHWLRGLAASSARERD